MNTETFKTTARTLVQNGVASDSHHATVKKEFRVVTGQALTPDLLPDFRALMEKFETAVPELQGSPDFDGFVEYGENWSKVIKATEYGKVGQPIRVLIACQDPQVDGSGESVCEKTRDIGIQDLFQVTRCVSCQKRALQIYRNKLARARRATQKDSR